MAKCGARNAKGKPCGMPALGRPGPPRCWRHAPTVAKERAKADRVGGRQRQRQLRRPALAEEAKPLETREDVAEAMKRIHNQVARGELAARDANAMLASLTALLATGTLPASPPPNVQYLSRFKRIFVRGDGIIEGELEGGLLIPLNPDQADAFNKALRADGPTRILVRRNGAIVGADGPEPEPIRGPGGLPPVVVQRGRLSARDLAVVEGGK